MNISIAHDFSDTPGGRTYKDGPYSGEKFRQEILKPALEQARETRSAVQVDLDEAEGFPSSFLEEAFGGLVRRGDYSAPDLHVLMKFNYTEPGLDSYVSEIWAYIEDAAKNRQAA